MRNALAFILVAGLLGGCASKPPVDPDGIWINQNAIDTAAKGANLRQSLLANGPNLEWSLNTKAGQATFSNGFEMGEGKLQPRKEGGWDVDFYGNYKETLSIKGADLTQAASDSGGEQHFIKAPIPAEAGAAQGSTFERALYTAYMGGNWKILDGPGKGGIATFSPLGQVTGLAGIDRYALCLAGDCAAMSGEYDSMWLEMAGQGNAFIFVRKGDQLEILQALNQAQNSEMPDLHPGVRRWLLEKK
ncbi:hypothetical protein [Pseudomonas sp. MWU16-30317]|uniref:hypothetical protein n=1 Tax=Pseudomonas sp. MWU16-30317 TaxID=2878095 RepID=UPI001CFB0C72|nr:hypothetical protein [Pseudomonas sp. MWU16-30317]